MSRAPWLERIIELDRRATPSPWCYEESPDATPIVFVPGEKPLRLATFHAASEYPRAYKRVVRMRGPIAIPEAWANAELVALLRSHLRALLEVSR